MLYYIHEEEKGHDPEAPELDRSLRALSSRWSDEGSQKGSQQKGMPRKGARMRVGDLVRMPGALGDPLGIITRVKPDGIHRGANLKRVRVFWFTDTPGEVSWEPRKWLKVINESR